VAQTDKLIRSDAAAAQATRATTRGFYHFKALAPSVCQVTYLLQVKLGGSIPKAIMASRTKQVLGAVQEMQAKFERKGKVVDAEMRTAFPLPPPLAELNDEQKLVVENCLAMETEEAWEPLESPHPLVRMWMKHAPPKRGERTIALGKATAVIDCSAHEATAYTFTYVSRERDRASCEEQHPARMLATTNTIHDNVIATIKKMPLLLRNREFVARQVCASDTSGDFLVAADPVDDIIDYGMTIRTVRGIGRCLTRITPLGISQCRVTIYQYLDAGGVIPRSLMTSKLPDAMSPAIEMRDEFQRDDEIDTMEWDKLARVIKDEQQVYSEDEDSLIQRVQDELGTLKEEDFEELESPDHLVEMALNMQDGGSNGVGRAFVTVDASVEQCAAWEMAKLSRAHSKRSSLLRRFTEVNSHNHVYHIVRDWKIPTFLPREWVTSQIWRNRGESIVVAYESREDDEFPVSAAYVRAASTAHWVYERLPEVGGVSQTLVRLTSEIYMGGNVTKFAQRRGTVKFLSSLSLMRKQFDRSSELDGATRALNVGLITHHMEQYSEEENALLEEGEKHFADFKETKTKSLKMVSPLTTGEIAFKKDSHAWGRATTTVRARPEEVLAYMLDVMKRCGQYADDLEKHAEQVNGHNQLAYVKKRSPKIFADRDFLARCVWKKEGEGFVYVTSPEESDARPIMDGVVRGKFPSAMRIKRKNDKDTTLEYVICPDFGGPGGFAYLMNLYIASNLSYVTEIQEYFQELRGLEEWDVDDARAVGEVMCIKTKAEKHPEKGENKQSARMRVLFKNILSLSEIGRRYEFFEGMMARVMRSTLKPAGDAKSKLSNVSLKEGETIGRGLSMALASNLTAEAAVDEWILKYRSLAELDRTEAWFR